MTFCDSPEQRSASSSQSLSGLTTVQAVVRSDGHSLQVGGVHPARSAVGTRPGSKEKKAGGGYKRKGVAVTRGQLHPTSLASPTPRLQPSTATPSSAPCGLVCIVVLSNSDLLRNPAALPCSLTHVTSYTSWGWRDSGVTLCFIVFQSHFALYIIKFHRVSVLFCVTHHEVS